MHSSTMKLKASELPGIMQTMTDMLRDHHQRHGDPAARRTVRNIQKVLLYLWGWNCVLDLTRPFG